MLFQAFPYFPDNQPEMYSSGWCGKLKPIISYNTTAIIIPGMLQHLWHNLNLVLLILTIDTIDYVQY